MCGICGLYGLEDKNLIKKMLSVMQHRGPDGFGIFTDKNISLGHVRLSIIDLSKKGKQPMCNENGDIWITYNGEIYNYKELRRDLRKYTFKSDTDTEVIIHAYEEYGLDFISKLRGMFAFVLWDASKKRFILARDPIGKKPLYYFFDGKKLIFASEIKAILQAFEQLIIKKSIDLESMAAYLAYQYVLGENTLFSNIKKILPGNILILENGQLVKKVYWDLREATTRKNERYFVTKLRERLEDSTKIRMLASDVPVGSFLSGGLDSSAITALARPYADYRFHTFSLGFESQSELSYAKIAADHFNTEHHEYILTDKDVINELGKIAWHFDEPLGDAAIINNYFLSKLAKRYVKVVLAGEGGDELFAGYSNYKRNLLLLKLSEIPFIRAFAKLVVSGLSAPYINRTKRNLIIFLQRDIYKMHLLSTRALLDEDLQKLTNLKLADTESKAIYPKNIQDPLNKMLAIDCKNLLPEKFLMKADKAVMANSVEERLPILDKKVVEFAFTIPSYFKLRGNKEKYVLRRAMIDLLPKEIGKRKKFGFGTPVLSWLNGELGDIVNDKINNGYLIKQYFNMDKVRSLTRNIKTEFQARLVWNIFALQLWYDTFL